MIRVNITYIKIYRYAYNGYGYVIECPDIRSQNIPALFSAACLPSHDDAPQR